MVKPFAVYGSWTSQTNGRLIAVRPLISYGVFIVWRWIPYFKPNTFPCGLLHTLSVPKRCVKFWWYGTSMGLNEHYLVFTIYTNTSLIVKLHATHCHSFIHFTQILWSKNFKQFVIRHFFNTRLIGFIKGLFWFKHGLFKVKSSNYILGKGATVLSNIKAYIALS